VLPVVVRTFPSLSYLTRPVFSRLADMRGMRALPRLSSVQEVRQTKKNLASAHFIAVSAQVRARGIANAQTCVLVTSLAQCTVLYEYIYISNLLQQPAISDDPTHITGNYFFLIVYLDSHTNSMSDAPLTYVVSRPGSQGHSCSFTYQDPNMSKTLNAWLREDHRTSPYHAMGSYNAWQATSKSNNQPAPSSAGGTQGSTGRSY
jgi:hypothetical protein